jgi:hypothetical protein
MKTLIAVLLIGSLTVTTVAQDLGRPLEKSNRGSNLIYYQPQLGDWKEFRQLEARMAVSLTPAGGDMAKLPAQPNWADFKRAVPPPTGVSTTAPKVFYSNTPAEILSFKGQPKYAKIPTTQLVYATNTESDLFVHSGENQYYYLVTRRWFRAKSLDGRWSYATADLPSDFARIPPNSERSRVLASVPGTDEAKNAVLLAQVPTTVIVDRAQAEAQVKVTYDGEPKFTPIESTSLSYASNTQEKTPAVADGAWHLVISPYLWFPGVHGTLGFRGRTASVDASAGDLLSHFRIGLMGTADLRHNRLLLPVDMIWIRLEDDKALPFPGLGESSADVRASQFVLTPKIGYRVVDRNVFKVDAVTGFRYWHVGQNLQFNPSGTEFSGSLNWVDPLVGGRIHAALSPKVSVTIAGDVGGWGAGSQLDYQVVGLLGYRIKPSWTLQAGYRYLYVNYRSGGVIFDAATSGVTFGASINLK